MLEETEELLVAVLVLAEPGHLPGGDFQGGEQGGGTMARGCVARCGQVASEALSGCGSTPGSGTSHRRTTRSR